MEQKDSKNRGFDVILGNPPWEVLKPEIDDFYGAIYMTTTMTWFYYTDMLNQQYCKKTLYYRMFTIYIYQ